MSKTTLIVPKIHIKCPKCNKVTSLDSTYWKVILNQDTPAKTPCKNCDTILELHIVHNSDFLHGDVKPPRRAKYPEKFIEDLRTFIWTNPEMRIQDIADKFGVTNTFVYRLKTGGR